MAETESENTCNWYDPSCALGWIRDELQAFGVWLWDSILSGLVAVFEAIPVPDFLENIGTHSLPPHIAWAASAFHLDIGIAIVVSAYTARFLLRRIPGIG